MNYRGAPLFFFRMSTKGLPLDPDAGDFAHFICKARAAVLYQAQIRRPRCTSGDDSVVFEHIFPGLFADRHAGLGENHGAPGRWRLFSLSQIVEEHLWTFSTCLLLSQKEKILGKFMAFIHLGLIVQCARIRSAELKAHPVNLTLKMKNKIN